MPAPKPPKKPPHEAPSEVDPVKGDALLKRLLSTPPKQHKDMIAERKAKRGEEGK